MSQEIRIKRRLTGLAGSPATLKSAELAYNMVDNVLYVGKGDNGSGVATSVIALAGDGAFAVLDSPAFTGTPTVPTVTGGDSSTKIATTAFVANAITAGAVADGNKGDIIVTNSGSTWTADPTTVVKTSGAQEITGNKSFMGATLFDDIAKFEAGITFGIGADIDFTNATVTALTKTDVGLSNVDNTSDANKPVSTAQQTALDLKADDADLTTHTSSTANPHSVTKAQVGLGNVTNTADSDKPVSTAQQTALDLKANLASPALTGTPTAPTAATANNTTQLATTAFVSAAIADIIDGAPGAIDTLNELAAALGDDPNFATTVTNDLATKLTIASNLSDVGDAAVARTNLGLGNVDNTSDASKPVSNATVTALSLKTDYSDYEFGTGINAPIWRGAIGLVNVDNTSDASKPVSTAQQTALDAKLNVADNLSDLANVATARTNLGLGTMATQNANTVAITGGTIDNVTIDGGTF